MPVSVLHRLDSAVLNVPFRSMIPSFGNNTFPALADIEDLKRFILNGLREGSSLSQTITDELSLLHLQIPLYDAEISRVECVLMTLKVYKEAINDYMRLQQSSLSPIRILPVEILAVIFEAACCTSSVGSKPFLPPTVLTSVCSHWRKVSLSTRILWTHITACHQIRPDNASLIARRIDHYQALSSPFSLTFHLRASYGRVDYERRFPDESGLDATGNAIAAPPVLDRCHSICFTMNSRGRAMFNAIESHYSLLKSLEIKTVGDSGAILPWAMCQNASNLERLHIYGPVGSLRIQLPSRNQITTLFLSNVRASLLKRFPKVIKATLVDGPSSSGFHTSGSDKPVPLALESLTLTNTLLEPIISDPDVSFPHLSSLEIAPKPCSESAATIFRNDLNNSLWQLCRHPDPSPITSLTFTKVPFADAQVRRMLKCIPHLKNLSIVEANERRVNCSPIISEILVTYLYEQAELESLKLVWAPSVDNMFPSLDHYKENIVMDMIEHHAYTGSLKSVVVGLRNGAELSAWTVERLRLLRRRGIKATQW